MRWLEGYKTKIGAAVLVLAGVAGFWLGLLNAAEAVVVIGLGLTAFGLGDKADRYANLLLEVVERAKEKTAAGKDAGATPAAPPADTRKTSGGAFTR